jgi:hypothetical protein
MQRPMKISAQFTRSRLASLGAFLVLVAAGSASAQTYSVSISGPNLGTIVSSASGSDTTFRVDPATQAVTRLSGGAVRMSSNLTRATVTVTCSGGKCNKTAIIKVGTIGAPTNRARKLTNLTVSMGTTTMGESPTGTDPILFTIEKLGMTSRTFYVGADFAVAPDSSGLGTGTSASGFYVSIGEAPATDEASATSAFTGTVYRPISIASPQGLAFGSIVKPPTGSGSISVAVTDGAPTVSGGVLIGATKQAKFSVTGEGGQAFTLSIPTSFDLTGPSTIPVDLSTNGAGSAILSSALGSAGTYNFNVGGSFSFDSATPTGSYTGQFSVIATYN